MLQLGVLGGSKGRLNGWAVGPGTVRSCETKPMSGGRRG